MADNLKLPPHLAEAERAVLSAVFVDPTRYDEVGDLLQADAFFSDRHKWIWRGIESIAKDDGNIDPVRVQNYLVQHEKLDFVGGPSYLAEVIWATPAVANVREHAQIVHDYYRQRLAMAKAQQIAAEMRGPEPEEGIQIYLEQVEREWGELASQLTASPLKHLKEHVQEADAAITARKQQVKALIGSTTGFAVLDKELTGWVETNLYIVAGRPGMGKTAFVLNSAVHTAKSGDGVAIFSLEMNGQQLAERMITTESGVLFERIRNPKKLGNADWKSVVQAQSVLEKLPIWVDDTSSTTLTQIRSRIRKLKSDIKRGATKVPCNGLKVVVIDYMQLMSGADFGSKVHNREQEIAALSRGLKNLAKTENVAVIALSQLNRRVETTESKRPQLSDLRESGAIEQDSDVVLFLYRPEYYAEQKGIQDVELQGWCEVIIAKQRGGATSVQKVAFRGETVAFGNLEQEDYSGYDPPDVQDGL